MTGALEKGWRWFGSMLQLDQKERETLHQLKATRRRHSKTKNRLKKAEKSRGQAVRKNEDLTDRLAEQLERLAEAEAETKRVETRFASLRRRTDAAQRALRQNVGDSVQRALEAFQHGTALDGSAARRAELLTAPDYEGSLRAEVRKQRGFSFEQAAHISTRGSGALRGTLLLNDTHTQNNVGCRATTATLVQGLERVGLPVERTITLLELTEVWRLLSRDVASQPSTENLAAFVDGFAESTALAHYRQLLERASHVVVNGEGSFYDRQVKGMILCVLTAYVAVRLGRPVAFVNLSASLSDPVMRSWAVEAFGHSRGVWLREASSLHFLENSAAGSPLTQVSADAAFTLVRQPIRAFNEWQWTGLHPDELLWKNPRVPYVVVTGTSSLFRSDREPAADPWDGLEELVKSLMAEGLDVVLYAADVSDGRLLRPLALKYQLPFVSAATPVPVVRSLLHEAECLISGRWHASILAATSGTPVLLGDANFYKTRALHEFLDTGGSMFDYRKLRDDHETILADLRRFIDSRAELQRSMFEKARLAAGLFDESVAQLAGRLQIRPS